MRQKRRVERRGRLRDEEGKLKRKKDDKGKWKERKKIRRETKGLK